MKRNLAAVGLSSSFTLTLIVWALWLLWPGDAVADSTFVYAVQVSAVVQAVPPQITLNWKPDPFGANSYTIYRKGKEDTTWGSPIALLPGSATTYTDFAVVIGAAYEYQIVKAASLGYKGFGYIYSGINSALTEQRGTVLLVVGVESVAGLDNEIAQLKSDLAGDGWTAVRLDVSTNASPESVHSMILGYYWADPAHVNAVFLLGHIPVLQSGYMDYDGHGARPMPADAYYGDIYYDWPTAPGSSPSYIPSDIALMVGRVDMANMPGAGAAVPWPNEKELLRRYLVKNHAWRQKLFTVPRRALMGNRRGDEAGLAVAASGYRAFEALVGSGTTVEANINDTAPAAQRWGSMLAAGSYLWAYGCGAGLDTGISYLGTHGTYSEVWSTDLVGQNARGVFMMVFGSHLGNWDHPDNIMRAVLATPDTGLACVMSGEPHWFLHHMGLGETIGYSTRLSLNNTTLYQNQVNAFNRAVYIALMGDPTLRLDPVSPPPWISASAGAGGVTLSWGTPSDPIQGFHVYRASPPDSLFVRLTPSLLGFNTFTDTSAPVGASVYMVRAVGLTTTPSGSYFNPSQGVFTTATVTAAPVPIVVQAEAGNGGLTLTWNSQPGAAYHVESAAAAPNQSNWVNISGAITASSTTTSWTDTAAVGSVARFYRVGTP